MFWVYILISETYGHHYIGHTDDPDRRLAEHNSDENVKYTGAYRPWKMGFKYSVSQIRGEAIIIERYLKRRKSRKLLEKLISLQSNQETLDLFFKKILENRNRER
jgi:putative endonuclease